jgi:regulatory protein YycI of two-component signal transduction system YycFG
MKKAFVFSIIVTCVVALPAFNSKITETYKLQKQNIEDSLEADRSKYVKLVMESIKGKENTRADSVFKNIKMLKMPAARLLKVMELGFSKSLGVSCGHCHNTSDFASEEKTQKEIARQMGDMTNKINSELLKNIQGLKGSPAMINCTTCHRGETKPALNLPPK